MCLCVSCAQIKGFSSSLLLGVDTCSNAGGIQIFSKLASLQLGIHWFQYFSEDQLRQPAERLTCQCLTDITLLCDDSHEFRNCVHWFEKHFEEFPSICSHGWKEWKKKTNHYLWEVPAWKMNTWVESSFHKQNPTVSNCIISFTSEH